MSRALDLVKAWREVETMSGKPFNRIKSFNAAADMAEELERLAGIEEELEQERANRRIKEANAASVPVYLVATGIVHEGQETYTRHDQEPILCDFERLYSAPVVSNADAADAESWRQMLRDRAQFLDGNTVLAFESCEPDGRVFRAGYIIERHKLEGGADLADYAEKMQRQYENWRGANK